VYQGTEKLLEYAQSHSSTEKKEDKTEEWRNMNVKKRLAYALVKVCQHMPTPSFCSIVLKPLTCIQPKNRGMTLTLSKILKKLGYCMIILCALLR
jgi:hypothetical protein